MMQRTLVVGALAAALVGLGSPAYAQDDPDVQLGEWVPFPDEYYEQEFEFTACDGEHFTITAGDERGAAERVTEYPDRIRIDYRGPETIDISREDGTVLDELDVGGKARTVIKPGAVDGLDKVREKLWGGSLALPFAPEESELLIEQLGTDFAYWEGEDEYVRAKNLVDPETFQYVENLEIEIEAEIIDLCEVFDDLARHQD